MKNIILLGCLLSAIITLNSCQDLLTETPESSYDSNLLFSTIQGAEMALNGAYATLALPENYGQYEMSASGSCDIQFITPSTGTDNSVRDANHYRLSKLNVAIERLWNHKYDGINRTNHIISQIQKMPEFESGNKKLITIEGQTRFLRALLGFDIIRYWGDAPFKTAYSASYEDSYQPIQTRDFIYDQVIADLERAIECLDWATENHNPERPSKGAARGLIMRVLLHRAGYFLPIEGGELLRPDDATRMKYFKRITDEFEEFEKNTFHKLCPDGYEKYWKNFCEKKTDPYETLYEVAFFTPQGNPAGGSLWGTYIGPLTDENSKYKRANAFFRVVRGWAKDYYDPNDLRKDVNICNYKIDKNSNRVQENDYTFYPGKWRREWMTNAPKNPNNADVNYVHVRYADVLLMAAEAYNEQGNTAKAKTLINTIRVRANAKEWISDQDFIDNYITNKWIVIDDSLIPSTDEQGKVRRALYWERGFELCFEQLRRFDLLRWGIIRQIIPKVESLNKKDGANQYSAGKYFEPGKSERYPIPQAELNVNYKIKNNNPGY